MLSTMRAPLGPLHGWDFWRSQLNSPTSVCAPMVDQSERAFRLLCRELGVGLCYTPMLHARLFKEVPAYRELHFDAHEERQEGPVFAQLAGHDPATVLEAAQMIEEHVDAIDLNFGCPQGIARKGRYGAFLLDEPDVMVSLVKTLADGLSIPVTAKLRLLPSRPASLELCKRLEDAGASVLTVHGRTREQNKQKSGSADWDAIATVVDALGVPVIANGGIATRGDVDECLKHTGAAAVMSSEGLLENPALFCSNIHPVSGEYLDQTWMAKRYLEICRTHPPTKGAAMVRGHLFKFLHNGLRTHTDLRDELLLASSLDELDGVVNKLEDTGWEQPMFHAEGGGSRLDLSWYRRHRVEVKGAGGEEAAMVDAKPSRVSSSGLRAALRRGGENGGGGDTTAPLAGDAGADARRDEVARIALERREKKNEERKRRNANRSKGGSRKQRSKAAKQQQLL